MIYVTPVNLTEKGIKVEKHLKKTLNLQQL